VFANVMCKWVSWRWTGIRLVCFPVWCVGGGCFDVCVVSVLWEECGAGVTRGRVPVMGRLVQEVEI